MLTWKIRSRSDILPTTQGILRRMVSKRLISYSLSIVHLLQYLRIPNLGRDFICHFKETHQSQVMRWVKNAALRAEKTNAPKIMIVEPEMKRMP
jgi:hypothetical protein